MLLDKYLKVMMMNGTSKIGVKFMWLTGRKNFGIEPEFFRPVLFNPLVVVIVRHNNDNGHLVTFPPL